MRDYQRKLKNPYRLPKTLYRRVLAVVRDYERQRKEINDILYGTNEHDGISSGIPSKPTESAAIRLLQYQTDVDAVEQALETVPKEYQRGVFDNICFGDKFPLNADISTWARWKAKFIYEVAKNINLV